MRLQALGGTAHWPLLALTLAAAKNEVALTWPSFFAVLLISLGFNTFGYLMNDLADEEIDRLDPARLAHPLHSGLLNAQAIRLLMWAQVPIVFALHQAAGFTPQSGLCLLLGLLCLAFYNHNSKSCKWPLLMDGLLGLSAASLVLFGGQALGQPVEFGLQVDMIAAAEDQSARAALVNFAFCALLSLVMINGFHNNLRDLPYEMATPRITTAKYLGAYLDDAGAPRMSRQMIIYGLVLHGLLLALAFLLCRQLNLSAATQYSVFALHTLNLSLFVGMIVTHGFRWQRIAGIHLLAFPLALMVPLAVASQPYVEPKFLFALALVYIAPPLVLLANRSAWRVGNVDAFALRSLD